MITVFRYFGIDTWVCVLEDNILDCSIESRLHGQVCYSSLTDMRLETYLGVVILDSSNGLHHRYPLFFTIEIRLRLPLTSQGSYRFWSSVTALCRLLCVVVRPGQCSLPRSEGSRDNNVSHCFSVLKQS
jgi:hypothetical protein